MLQDKKDSSIAELTSRDASGSAFSFEDLFEESTNAMAIFRGRKIVAVNSHACELFGYTKNEMLSDWLGEKIVPEDYVLDVTNNIYSRASHSYILDMHRKSNESISVGVQTNFIFEVKDIYRLCTYSLMQDDVDFNKSSENFKRAMSYPQHTILEEKEKFEFLFNISFNAYAVHVDGFVLEVNDMFTQLYGYSKAEMVGKYIFDVGFYDDASRRLYIDAIKQNPYKHTLMVQRRKDGSMFHAELISDFGVLNGQKVRIVIIRDISDQVNAEKKLLDRNRQLVEKNRELQLVSDEVISSRQTFYKTLEAERDHIDSELLDGVVVYGSYEFDIDDHRLHLSDEVMDILEVEDALLSTSDSEILSLLEPTDRVKLNEQLGNAIVDHSLLKIEVTVNVSESKSKYVLIQGIVQYAADGNASRIAGTVLDITERKLIENRLQRQNDHYLQLNEELVVARKKAEDSERLKTSFFSNMSHEIRTPMNGILGFSGLLLEEGLDEDERFEYAKVISDSGKRLLHIVNDILDISKLESDTVKIVKAEVNVNNLLMELHRLFSKNERVLSGDVVLRLVESFVDKDSVIVTDDTRLNQILFNLLSNALKFTKKGFVSFGCTLSDKMVCFYVKDTGIGIPSSMHEQVFEPFRQVEGHIVKQHGGTGLGLSISRKLAKLLGGKLTLESKAGEGATFSVYIPCGRATSSSAVSCDCGLSATKVAVSSCATLENTSCKKSSLKLLLAEDDDVNYLFYKSFLQKRVTLLRATTGVEAVDMVFSDPEIDIVLMDIKMPEMNGLDAIKKIRTEYATLPIIVQTAYAMGEDRKLALDAGANDYVSKPINRRLLLKKIEELCKS